MVRYLKLAHAARALRVSKKRVQGWRERGMIQANRGTDGEKYMYDIDSAPQEFRVTTEMLESSVVRVGYARVSSRAGQAYLQLQVEKLGTMVGAAHVHTEVSEGDEDGQPVLTALLRRVEGGLIQEILVTSQDRLGALAQRWALETMARSHARLVVLDDVQGLAAHRVHDLHVETGALVRAMGAKLLAADREVQCSDDGEASTSVPVPSVQAEAVAVERQLDPEPEYCMLDRRTWPTLSVPREWLLESPPGLNWEQPDPHNNMFLGQLGAWFILKWFVDESNPPTSGQVVQIFRKNMHRWLLGPLHCPQTAEDVARYAAQYDPWVERARASELVISEWPMPAAALDA